MRLRNAPRPVRIRESFWDRAFDLCNVCILSLLLVLVLYPLYFILVASFTDPTQVFASKVLLWPRPLYLRGYEKIIAYEPLWQGYRQSFVYTALGTCVNLGVTLPGAYALSRKDLPGRGLLMGLFAFTMFFSGGLVPSYLINKALGLRNNLWAMILPMALSVWNLIIARTFFQSSLPSDLLEAARIDGCGDFRFFFGMALPLSKAVVAVLALYSAVSHWNSYFHALIYLDDVRLYPLQLILRNLLIVNTITNTSMVEDAMVMLEKQKLADQLKYGVIIVSSLPLLLMYPLLQKYFMQGVMVGSLKG